MLMKSPLGFKGTLTLSPSELRYKAQGMLTRSVLKIKSVSFPLDKIGSLIAEVVSNPQLVLTCEPEGRARGARYTFYCRAAETLLDELVPLWADALKAQTTDVGLAARRAVMDAAEQHEELAGLDSEVILTADHTIYHVRQGHAVRSWLVLTEESFYCLPDPISDFTEYVSIPNNTIRPLPIDRYSRGHLQFEAGGKHMQFYPCSGDRFRNEFWQHVVNQGAIQGLEPPEGVLDAVVGDSVFARMVSNNELLVMEKPGKVIQQPDGLGLVVTDQASAQLSMHHPLTIDIGGSNGLLRFDTVVRRRRERTESQDLMLVVEYPTDISFHQNRRTSYRIRIMQTIKAQVLEGDLPDNHPAYKGLPCLMFDICVDGCSFFHNEELTMDTRLLLQIPGDDQILVQAEVVATSQHKDSPGKWMHGCAFRDLQPTARSSIFQMILKKQRQEIKRQRR